MPRLRISAKRDCLRLQACVDDDEHGPGWALRGFFLIGRGFGYHSTERFTTVEAWLAALR